jgi:protein-tyrosine phosphatase
MPELFRVATPYPGRLAVVERPRGGDWLAADMAALRAAGVDVLVSALVNEELTGTWLEREAEAAEAAGLRFVRFPMSNLGVPADSGIETLAGLANEIRDGRYVAAHCFASVGRSPLIVASLMVMLGAEPDFAWDEITISRGRQVPDTLEQRAWVCRFVTA